MTEYIPPYVRLDPRLAERLADKRAQLAAYLPISPAIMYGLSDRLRVLLSFHSNAIEGNTLTLQETRRVIDTGEAIAGHSVRELLEATNHAAAVTHILELVQDTQKITRETVLSLHQSVMTGLMPNPGAFRVQLAEITGRSTKPPPPQYLPRLMEEWVDWVNDRGKTQYGHPLMRSAIAHHRFEEIHPFADGNGRVGRLLLNLMLLREGYAPAILLRDWRIRYYRALREADNARYNALVELVGWGVLEGFGVYLAACETQSCSQERPLRELAEMTGYDQEYLSLLCRTRKLDATKKGRVWYTTVTAIEEYTQVVKDGSIPRGRPPHHST